MAPPLLLSQCKQLWPKTMQTKRKTMVVTGGTMVTKGGLEAITRIRKGRRLLSSQISRKG